MLEVGISAIHSRQRGSAHEALIIRLLSTCVTKLLGSQRLHHWCIHIIKTKRRDAMQPRQVAKASGLQESNCALPPYHVKTIETCICLTVQVCLFHSLKCGHNGIKSYPTSKCYHFQSKLIDSLLQRHCVKT